VRRSIMMSTFLTAVLSLALPTSPCLAQSVPPRNSTLTGRIVDTVEVPVRFAQILLVNGTEVTVSDAAGRFKLNGLGAGRNIFEVRRIGYDPVVFAVNFTDSVSIDVKIRMHEIAKALPEVKIEATSDPLKAVGFYERMAAGHGHFISPERLAQMRPVRATDAFAAIPNLVVDRRGSKSRVMTSNYRCEYGIVVDNVIIGQAGSRVRTTSPDDLVSASDLYAIEVYPRNRGLPPRFLGMNNQDGCGTIVIWTKGMLPR
jgi:hypothetical protein